MNTPSKYFGLTTYQSKPVLVGGTTSRFSAFNELWTLSDDRTEWVHTDALPPMPTARWSPSVVNAGTPECLIIAGGTNRCDRDIIHGIASHKGAMVTQTLTLGLLPDRGNAYASMTKNS